MATDFQNTLKGGTHNTAITAANSGGASGNAFSYVIVGSGGASLYWDALGERYANTDYGSSASYFRWDDSTVGAGDTRRVASCRFRLPSHPSPPSGTNGVGLINIRDGSDAILGSLQFLGGNIRALNRTWGVVSGSSESGFTVNTWYRAELALTSGASTNGRLEYAIYDDSEELLHSFDTGYTIETRETNPARVRFGENNNSNATVAFFTDFRTGSRESGWLGPIIDVPVVEASPNQYGVEALDEVIVSATANKAVTEWEWTQTAGAPVSLVNGDTDTASFIAPGLTSGTDITLSVTGDGSSPSSVTIEVLPHIEYALSGNLWVPVRKSLISEAA